MNLLIMTTLALVFSTQVFAQDVFMATSEDLKEFDHMLAGKKPPEAVNLQNPQQNGTKNKKNKKNRGSGQQQQQGLRPNGAGPGQPPPNGQMPPPPPQGAPLPPPRQLVNIK